MAEAVIEVDLQRVVIAVAPGEPCPGVGEAGLALGVPTGM